VVTGLHEIAKSASFLQLNIIHRRLQDEITRCGKGLRNRECVIETTNQRYSALFRIALIGYFNDAFSIPQSFMDSPIIIPYGFHLS